MSERHLQVSVRALFPNRLSALLEHKAQKIKSELGTLKAENVKQSQPQTCPKCSSLLVPGVTCSTRAKNYRNGNSNEGKSQSKNRRSRARNSNKSNSKSIKFEAKLRAKLGEKYTEITDLRYLHYRCTMCDGELVINVTPSKSSKPKTEKGDTSSQRQTKIAPKQVHKLGGLSFCDFLL